MKKTLTFALLALFAGLFAPGLIFAATGQGYVPLAPIPGLTSQTAANSVMTGSFAVFFNNLYKYLVGLAAVLAIIMIVWSGVQIMLNRDNVSTAISSRGRIGNAVFGLILVLSPVLVFSIINPSILNLSLTIPGLQLDSAWDVCPLNGGYGVWNPNINTCQAGTPHVGNPCVDASGNTTNTYWSGSSCAALSSSSAFPNQQPVACQSGGQWGTCSYGPVGGCTCDTNQPPANGTACTVQNTSGYGQQSGTYDASTHTCVVTPSGPTTAAQASQGAACQLNGTWGTWQTSSGGTGGGICDTSKPPANGTACTAANPNGYGQQSGTYDASTHKCVLTSANTSNTSNQTTTSSSNPLVSGF